MHYGDDQDGIDIPGEEGELFENVAYGQVITEVNSGPVIKNWITNHPVENKAIGNNNQQGGNQKGDNEHKRPRYDDTD